MSELTCLELSIVLWVVHVLVQASFGNAQLPSRYLLGSRDEPANARGVFYGRACRALGNYLENFTPFVALALALPGFLLGAHVHGHRLAFPGKGLLEHGRSNALLARKGQVASTQTAAH